MVQMVVNDEIENAIVVAGDSFTYSGTTTGATAELGEEIPYGADEAEPSVWFVYTPSGTGETGFEIEASWSYGIVFYKSLDGSSSMSSLEAGNSGYSGGGGGGTSYLYPEAGYTYYIQLTGENVDYTITQVSGSAGVDTSALYGTPSADALGTLFDGAKTMIGGLGNDLYYVDNVADVVTEDANAGTDSIYTLVDYALPANVEKIVGLGSTGLTLTGNGLDNQLFGAAGADTRSGGLGNDKLDGRGGADSMVGGDGDDTYYVNDASDVVVELADEGTDTVYTTIDYTLTANVEKVIVRSSDGLIVTANDSDNVMTSGAGRDRLSGGDGADRINGGGDHDLLIGGAGKDILTGGAGNDTFLFAGVDDAGDTITDFQIGSDFIAIDVAGFGLTSFDASQFESNARGIATTEDARFIYSENLGRLLFDADGSGAGRAVLIATLRGAPELTADHFLDADLFG